MSDAPRSARSFEAINDNDLRRLEEIARERLARVCRPQNASSIFADRLRLLCLCQGAALHHQQGLSGTPLDKQRGIHDFDVWGFFESIPGTPLISRKPWECDFGASRFGNSPGDDKRQGRKVDVLGRAIEIRDDESVIEAVLRWIASRPTGSPAEIRKRPIIVISPGEDFGRCIWDGTEA